MGDYNKLKKAVEDLAEAYQSEAAAIIVQLNALESALPAVIFNEVHGVLYRRYDVLSQHASDLFGLIQE